MQSIFRDKTTGLQKFIIETFLGVRKIKYIKNKLIDETIKILEHIFNNLIGKNDEDKKLFMEMCIIALLK